ncbi:hypothetical protein BO70DRAFT_93032 [Aspergillus heteromorphus CBS 117.55]|uniref:Uncharacterized protein n=1 Tax=Aspergillus heteromorphus CBS 117.55 TaxID=1448321 RepID=A0A317VPH8_9EURO|nr:uncharacterized protein BO70DRAFT_93032 [Aspergillus heteromorphus CBS 117.55]PWY76256.1 hypothetical protein BO70DRAFT_93032 [Aspergillus heteromorphus CBS 117.55]
MHRVPGDRQKLQDSTMNVDRRSGQVYLESTAIPSLSSSRGPAWVHETPFLPQGWEETSDAGPPSLKHAAMRQLLSDQRNLQPTLFAHVPWRIASYLWDCLGRSRKRTLHMWKLFATAYPEEFRHVSPYRRMKIEGPRLSLREYLGLVKSDSMGWRVVLTLAASHARVPELVEISSIRNLAALEIATPKHAQPVLDEAVSPLAALSDRIVRTWSELAAASGAFAHLRVLVLAQQTELSGLALRYLRAFPSLQLIMVLDCPGLVPVAGVDAEANGWEVVLGSEKPETLYECYRISLTDGTVLDGPVLDFQVGYQTGRALDNMRNMRQKPWTLFRRREKVEGRERGPPAAKRARVMKAGRGKDLGGLLREFL